MFGAEEMEMAYIFIVIVYVVWIAKDAVGQVIGNPKCGSRITDDNSYDLLLKIKEMEIELSAYREKVENMEENIDKMDIKLSQCQERHVELKQEISAIRGRSTFM